MHNSLTATDGRHVDNRPAPFFPHYWNCETAHHHHTGDVYAEISFPGFEIDVDRIANRTTNADYNSQLELEIKITKHLPIFTRT
jgi:hypothetical protein